MSADEKKVLLKMVRRLLEDLQAIQQRGAGYYECDSFINRYNKLLKSAEELFPASRLMSTFSPIESIRSVDPADKMKMTQKVLIEGNQLAAFIESYIE